MTSWLLGLTGLSGIIGLAVLAVVGGPIVPTLAKIADAIFTPVAGALGSFFASLFKMELDGTLDILASGQRILAVVTMGCIIHAVAVHQTWKEVHAGYTLIKKTPAPAHPVKRYRR